jgi:hypothetical protein
MTYPPRNKRPDWGWTPEQEAELRRLWPTGMAVKEIAYRLGKGKQATGSRAHKLGMTRPNGHPKKEAAMVEADDVFSDRRARELERRLEEQAARETRAAEEQARRERAPVRVGVGRIYKP